MRAVVEEAAGLPGAGSTAARRSSGSWCRFCGPSGAVDEGEAREEAGLLGLRQAAGDDHDAGRVLALEPRRVAQVAGEAVVGALAHGAGVVDEHVGVVGLVRALQAFGLEQRADALGVVLVHLAAERAQVVAAGHAVALVAGAALRAPRRYLAMSTARLSRMTVTLIWPG